MALRFDGRITGPGDLGKYTEVVCAAPDRITIVQDPLGQKGWVVQSLLQTDDPLVRNGYRAELYANGVQRAAPFIEWYEWDVMVRRSEYIDKRPESVIFLQIHDAFSGGATPHLPPIEVSVNERQWLKVVLHSSATADPQFASDVQAIDAVNDYPFVFDAWHRIVIRTDYKLDGTGQFDLWCDGVRVCALRNIYNAYPTNPLFVQSGAYSGARKTTDRKAVYSTGYRIYDDATTHAEMGVSADIPLVSSGRF